MCLGSAIYLNNGHIYPYLLSKRSLRGSLVVGGRFNLEGSMEAIRSSVPLTKITMGNATGYPHSGHMPETVVRPLCRDATKEDNKFYLNARMGC